jgi:hypothetical protein
MRPTFRRSRTCVELLLPLLLVLPVASCTTVSPEFVEQRHYEVSDRPIIRVAVLPFYPKPRLSRANAEGDTPAWEAAALVTRFVTDAIAARGVSVIPESDVQLAFAGGGLVTPRSEPKLAAQLAAKQFGATAVLLGDVDRYRERSGSSYGSEGTASVQFEVTLYQAPEGTKLWTGRFDQTQPNMAADVFTATRYPGGGTRFLTVAELARWGAELVAAEMPIAARQ